MGEHLLVSAAVRKQVRPVSNLKRLVVLRTDDPVLESRAYVPEDKGIKDSLRFPKL